MSAGLTAFQLAFQLSPIILVNGISSLIPGSMLPIIAITETINFTAGLLTGGNVSTDNFFANFRPLPGSSLIDQDLGRYPFANQGVAANAVIAQPLTITMQMVTPVRNPLGYAAKLAIMEVLQTVLSQHNASGGTYIVATPSYIYTGCVMRSMRDASSGDSRQAQNAWQFEFEQPLLTLGAAQQAMKSLNKLISSGLPINGAPSAFGLGATLAQPSTLATAGILPTATSSLAAGSITVSPLPAP